MLHLILVSDKNDTGAQTLLGDKNLQFSRGAESFANIGVKKLAGLVFKLLQSFGGIQAIKFAPVCGVYDGG